MTESHPGDNLGDKKKQNHIHTQQSTEIPARGIDYQPVSGQGSGAAKEGQRTADAGRTIQSRLKAGVAVRFQDSSQKKDKESPATMYDDVIKKISHTLQERRAIVVGNGRFLEPALFQHEPSRRTPSQGLASRSRKEFFEQRIAVFGIKRPFKFFEG